MNILFIGPYRQNDEWGKKSQNILTALKKTSHNITSRPIFLNNNENHNQDKEESELQIFDHYEMIIQFLLQPHATYIGEGSKNIGIFNHETIPYKMPLGRFTHELLMDEIWTDSSIIQKELEEQLIAFKPNMKVVCNPISIDINNLPSTPEHSFLKAHPNLEQKFNFYYMGNPLDPKDGFKETVIAYNHAFTNTDLVALTILCEIQISENQIHQLLTECQQMHNTSNNLHVQPLMNILIPPSKVGWSQQDKISLHSDADCMVAPSYSICANTQVLEAAVYQSTPLINKYNAAYEVLGSENTWPIDCHYDFCDYPDNNMPYRFTSQELWQKPTIISIAQNMQKAYNDKYQRDMKKAANSKLRIYFEKISYDNFLNERDL